MLKNTKMAPSITRLKREKATNSKVYSILHQFKAHEDNQRIGAEQDSEEPNREQQPGYDQIMTQ